jgi:hypothetical protein
VIKVIYNPSLKPEDCKVPKTQTEKEVNLENLEKISQEWMPIIERQNHLDKLLNEIAREFRVWKKKFEKNPVFSGDHFFKGKFVYRTGIKQLVLLSKYLYLMAKDILIYNQGIIKNITFCGIEIWFTEYSIAHIVFGHYGEGVKPRFYGKSHFYNDSRIHPRDVISTIRGILTKISISGIMPTPSSEQLRRAFQIPIIYNSQPYAIWLKEFQMGQKGKGMVTKVRVESFYPLKEVSEIDKIGRNFEELKIDEELSVLKKKPNVT